MFNEVRIICIKLAGPVR